MGNPQLVSVDSDTLLFPTAVMTALSNFNDQRYRSLAAPPVTITVEHKVQSPIGYWYVVTRARTGGTSTAPRFVPGIVDKRYGNDFDVTNPTSTGTAFKPAGERVDAFARRTGATLVTNASGWNVTSNFGEMRGAQIRNGKIFHDFEATNLNGSPAGVEGLGLLQNGQVKCYSARRGDTAASMVAAGVVHSWSYGPNLVVNGTAQDLTSDNWQYFATESSARTIIGQGQNGDVIVISVLGKTAANTPSNATNGITGNDMVALAVAEGCYNASTFDGGGSTQAYAQGLYTMPSSDDATGYDGTVGRRKVGDCFMLTGVLATASVDTGWKALPLRSGYVAYDANSTPQIRQLNGLIEMRGVVKPTSGNFPTTDVAVADLSQFFRFASAPSKSWTGAGNGGITRKIAINTDFSVNVVGSSTTPAYIALDEVKWGADTLF
ncbi:phosphodiester glycosidase family protein [Curtobacterium pusillum]|uniref:phosphodiester glycosidase family protein n=1 Tax=Curtobacterium pusillum TaxID=69373 RepID=UPI0037F80EDA